MPTSSREITRRAFLAGSVLASVGGMTLARRLLMGGGGSFVLPGFEQRSLALTAWWNDVCDPVAVTHNGVTYFGAVNDSGTVYVGTFDQSDNSTSSHVVGTSFSSPSGNIHNSIALLVRSSDHRLLLAELNEECTLIIVNTTVNSLDSDPAIGGGFNSPTSILSGGNYTYAALYESEGLIWLWTSSKVGGTFYGAYSTSSDDGATWSAMHSLISPVASDRTYRRIGSNGSRIDIFTTDTDRTVANPSSIYHGYVTGGNLYQSDGTLVGAISGTYAASALTLVQDTTYGRCRPEGWAYDSLGRPACNINSRDLSANTPPEYVRIGRFNGSTWTTHAVADAGAQLISTSALVKDNPNELWMPVLVGSALEIFRYVSNDNGATWTGTQMTSGSTDDNDAPETPVDATALRAIWGYGTYTGPGFSFADQAMTYGTP